ncbi:rhodanese-like domain-containing protein [Roseateles cellulosilyticus]|uniref:Rhodanese-like domain-containing protein n=1 Tax=Pelomonas cellulosilytica TaxID=2906762 RepID=A0ABS8XU78_9BURK|nr:rhodanese-like domain-containing protein [Pelomonas sp. P8]
MALATTLGTVFAASKPPAGVEDFQPAAAMCRIDDLRSDAAGNAAGVADAVADVGCLLAPAQVAALQEKGNPVVADLRGADAYAVSHLPDAILLSPVELRTKPYWKDRTVVLVGSGKGERQQLQLCSALRAGGHANVYVLRGGMAAWGRDARPEAGRPADLDSRAWLTAGELFIETQDPAALLLVPPSQSAVRTVLGAGQPLDDEVADVQRAEVVVRKALKAVRTAPARVVLVAPRSWSGADLDALARKLLPLPLLAYRDGASAVDEFVRGHRAGLVALARGPKVPRCGL